jgi:hypothetical protein
LAKKAAVKPRFLLTLIVLTFYVADSGPSRDQANVYYIVSGNDGQVAWGRFILTFDKFIGSGILGSAWPVL